MVDWRKPLTHGNDGLSYLKGVKRWPIHQHWHRCDYRSSVASGLRTWDRAWGGLIQGVGAAWMMTTISDSAKMVALVQASTTLPIMLFSLVSGAVADSFDRRRVMLTAQTFMALAAAALAISAGLDALTPWALLGFTFLMGCGAAFNGPAWQASVGDLVPREQVSAAVLLNSVSFNVVRSVGPAIGGIIVAAAGAATAFGVNAVSYFGVIAVLWKWRPERGPSVTPPEALRAAMGTGLRYVALSPNILTVLLRGFLFGGTTIVLLALLPLVARSLVAGDALTYGLLLGAFGVGAVAGAAGSKRLRDRISNETLVRVAFAVYALVAAATALSTEIALTMAVLAVAGAAWVIALSLFNTTVQLSTPRWVVGRALSLYQMAIFAGMALGSWVWGSIAESTSLATALLLAAIAMVFGALVGLKVPLLSSEVLNLDPLNHWREPTTSLAIEPRSGPIAIAIAYQIAEKDQLQFQELMMERRRVRRRDGAHDWTLAQDLADTTLWIERFDVPTWLDYVRLHSRTTQADAPLADRILALHQGDQRPLVLRMLEWKGRPVRISQGPAGESLVEPGTTEPGGG